MMNLRKFIGGGSRLFVNPPFSKMDEVANWVIKQADLLNEVWLLIPARTDTKYFRRLIDELGEFTSIIFITGRLKYNDAGPAPFPTMLMIINKNSIKNPQTFSVMSLEELINDLKLYL